MYSCVDGLPHRLLETLFSLVLYRHRPIRLASLVSFPSGEGFCAGDSVYVSSFGRRCPEGAEVGFRSGAKGNVREAVFSYFRLY